MRFASLLIAFIALAASATSLQAQQVTPNYRVVDRGRTIRLDSYYSVDPTCRSLGRTVLNLVSAPQGGQVLIESGTAYPNFPSTNVRFSCNRLRVPATSLYYRAAPDFTGQDSFTVEAVFPAGFARQTRYTVYVR